LPPPAPGPLEPLGFADATGEPLGDARFIGRARAARYVLVGEAHDVACHHRAQARIIDLLGRAAPPPQVGLEMVSVERQPTLDAFNAGTLGVDSLAGALDWERAWGVPFELYAPVFHAARDAGAAVFALNTPRRLVRQVADHGLDSVP